ncbi:hypothetical protein F8388_022321 [Cannabis sativa]|uniref:DUF4283 domain-containing protein n=1 Tax=Cannabis sativa TaxID=3483 RepID=A0A7J6EBK9_CANSA|nr:hypothetical protein F8388_022321 [Cannabis sativa]
MKKKKVTRNPTIRSKVEDPPSNQEFKIVDECAIDEPDGIAILEIQLCSQMIEDEELSKLRNGVLWMNMGLTIVKFNDEATPNLVLEFGVVQFDKKLVIVCPWTQDLDIVRLVHFVPLWIRLPNLCLQYYGHNCLSALVSTIGKPIMVAKVTLKR